jgi:hypothetical protein
MGRKDFNDIRRHRALHKSALGGEDFSRKGAKTQSAAALRRFFFASLRLCARKIVVPVVRRDFDSSVLPVKE